jgi:hypothetical protein
MIPPQDPSRSESLKSNTAYTLKDSQNGLETTAVTGTIEEMKGKSGKTRARGFLLKIKCKARLPDGTETEVDGGALAFIETEIGSGVYNVQSGALDPKLKDCARWDIVTIQVSAGKISWSGHGNVGGTLEEKPGQRRSGFVLEGGVLRPLTPLD